MATVEINEQNFNDSIAEGTIILDFWAEWCGPCRMFAPIFEETSEKYPDVTFGKVDTEANQNLAGALGVQSIPTVMIFRDGTLVYRHSGVHSAAQLNDVLDQTQALDMDDVHRQIAEQEKNEQND